MPRKGENIYRRQDGRWEARYIHHYEGGKARYRYVYGTTYLEVREKKQSAQAKVNGHGEPYAPGIGMRLTFSVLAEMWLSDIRVAVKESTYTRYHRIVSKYLIPRVGGQVLSRMDNKHFRHFRIAACRRRDLSWTAGAKNGHRHFVCSEIYFALWERQRLSLPGCKLLKIATDNSKKCEDFVG